MALVNQPVVIDNGSGVIKAGFAGEDTPRCLFPSWVGRHKYRPVMVSNNVENDAMVGPKAQEYRGLLKIRYPVRHGVVEDWEDMERIWNYIYKDELKTSPEEHPVLLTEAPLNPRQNRERAAQLLFETFNVPALYICTQAVLSLYSTGRTTGLVLDSGDGVTHCVPVFEGFALDHAVRRIDIAGRDVTEHLQLLLRKNGYCFTTSSEMEVVRAIKEKMCYVSTEYAREVKESAGRSAEYTLPDGTVIKLGDERFRAPEILFQPDLHGEEYQGIHQILVDSIRKTDLDLRQTLYGNIVLSGGSTLFKGFGDRLLAETKKAAPQVPKIKIYAPPERKYSTWMGGSILAGLASFKKIWVSAEEYQEDQDIINKKLFS